MIKRQKRTAADGDPDLPEVGDSGRTVAADGEAYARKKAKAAEKSREIAAAGKEIGELPPVGDYARKEACRLDLKLYLESYLKPLYPLRWSVFHLAAIKILQDLILKGGLFANAMPRASGKSTLIIGAILWAGTYGHSQYAAIVAATDDAAGIFIDDIKTQLENNPLLLEDFPEVCYPIRCLERTTQRAKGQTYQGVHTTITWQADTIVFPTIAKYASSGFRISTRGITGNIRGLRFMREDLTVVRPDFIIIEDPQTDESAKSEMQTKDRIDKTQGAILGLFGPTERKSAAMAITVIRKGDYADYYLASVDWQGQRCGLLNKIPSGNQLELWVQYREIQKERIAQRCERRTENDFYLANEAALTEDLEATWPDRFNPEDELSAIQSAMNLYFLVGSKKFKAEYMNEPEELSEGEIYKLSPIEVRGRTSTYSRYLVPPGFDFLTVGIDIQLRLIWYTVMAWKMDLTGSIIDYGWYPSQRSRRFTLDELSRTLQSESKATDADVDAAVSWGLMQLGKDIFGRKWERKDGSEIFIPAAQIDMNWKDSESAVMRFCTTSPWKSILMPARGMAVTTSRARKISTYTPKDGETFPKPEERHLCEWMVTGKRQQGARICQFDPNHWKTHVNMAMSLPQHSSGSIDIYGENPDEHEMLAEHVTSHYPVEVTIGALKQTQWKLRPGVERDDLLDTVIGCCVSASRHGARLTRNGTALPVIPKTKRKARYVDLPAHMKVG